MEAQKEGKKIKTLSTKSTGRDAISQWQFAEAETKQESKNKRVNILLWEHFKIGNIKYVSVLCLLDMAMDVKQQGLTSQMNLFFTWSLVHLTRYRDYYL